MLYYYVCYCDEHGNTQEKAISSRSIENILQFVSDDLVLHKGFFIKELSLYDDEICTLPIVCIDKYFNREPC